jgi:hypothetical protein
MATIPKGTLVRQVLPAPVIGHVTEFTVDQETGEVVSKVEWTDDDGASCARFFKQEEIEAIPLEE